MLKVVLLLAVSLSCLVGHSNALSYLTAAQCAGYNGVAYRSACYIPYTTGVNWAAARSNCQAIGADLASIYTAAENAFFLNLTTSRINGDVWIGLSSNSSNWYSWSWVDLPAFEVWRAVGAGTNGSSPNGLYTNWNAGEPNGNGVCAQFYTTGLWDDLPCTSNKPYTCKALIGPKTKSSCTSLNGTIYSTNCYWPVAGTGTWFSAEQFCRYNGGQLASPRSAAENSAIWNMSYAPVTVGTWLGGSDQGSEGTWYYTDNYAIFSSGSTVQNGYFVNWNSGEPNNQGGSENCLTFASGIVWNDLACTTTTLAGICQTQVDVVAPTITGCPSDIYVTNSATPVVTWTTPTFYDAGGISTNVLTSSPTASLVSGSTFPFGSTLMTYTVTDTSNNVATCTFTVNVAPTNCTLTPPYLDLTASSTNGGNLTISIVAPASYTSFVSRFVGGSSTGVCNSDNETSWWTPISVSGCNQRMTITNTLNTMIGTCNFKPDETNATQTVFRGTITVTTTQNSGTIRGTPIVTTTTTSIAIGIAFLTSISATAGSLQVSGTISVFATITTQTFNPLTSTATLTLLTSTPYPFQLWTPRINTQALFTATIVPVTAESTIPSASVCNVTGTDSYVQGNTCTQTWYFTISPTSTCPTQNNLNFNNWNITFYPRCHSAYTGACVNSNSSNNTVTFSTASDNYCPQFITNSASASASMGTFSDVSLTVPQTQFVFGAKTYFSLVVTSPIQMSNVHFERIALLTGAASGVSNLYTKTFTTPSAFFAASGTYVSSFNNAPTSMTVTDVNGAATYNKTASFSFIWNSAVSGATGDNAMPATVIAQVRIRYANVTTVGEQTKLLHVSFPLSKLLEDSSSPQVSSTVQVSISASASANSPTTASSSPLGLGLSVTMFAGLVAAVVALVLAVVVLGVVFVRRQSRNTVTKADPNVESVQLTSTASSTA